MFCGIDLGTSSVKASVFDEHGRQLAFSRREIDLVLPQTGLAELSGKGIRDITGCVGTMPWEYCINRGFIPGTGSGTHRP